MFIFLFNRFCSNYSGKAIAFIFNPKLKVQERINSSVKRIVCPVCIPVLPFLFITGIIQIARLN